MKIAIIGAGNVGTTLGSAWVKAGNEVTYGVRSPKQDAHQVTIDKALSGSEIVVLAVPWSAIPSVLENRDLYKGKIVVDCTNPINSDFTGLSIGNTDSAGETVARMLPESKIVKAFNTCGFNVMADPKFSSGHASMFVASDHKSAKEEVLNLAKSIGFEPVDVGPLVQSRYLEALAWLWISLAMKYGAGREIAFQLMKR